MKNEGEGGIVKDRHLGFWPVHLSDKWLFPETGNAKERGRNLMGSVEFVILMRLDS